MSKSVLITGGAGFLGAHVASRLIADGFDVHIPVRGTTDLGYLAAAGAAGKVKLHTLDPGYANLSQTVEEIRPTVAIHLASKSRGGETDADIADYIDFNVLFPSLLMNALRRAGTGCVINCGTSWQWGEDGAYRPFNFYAATKEAFESLLAHFAGDGMRAITLRMFDIYGAGDKRAKVVDLIIQAALSGEPLGMTAGEQEIDLVHVDDAGEAVRLAVHQVQALPAGQQQVFGVSGNERLTVKALAGVVGEIIGQAPPIEWGKRPYRPREIMKPYDGFARLPGWAPGRPLREGLREVIVWRRQSATSAR